MTNFIRRYPLLAFFLLAYAFTWVVAVPLLASKRGWLDIALPHWLEPLAAFGPFAAAMFVARALDGRAGPRAILKSLTRWQAPRRWQAFAVISPIGVLALTVIAGAVFTDWPGASADAVFAAFSVAGLAELIFISSVLQSWGEEPGWRGFALPQLRKRWGPLGATLVLWPVWLLWHLPFFVARPEFGWAQWAGFSLGILSAAAWLTLLWDATESILLCVLWHAMINLTRGIALMLSTSLFLIFGNIVLLAGLVMLLRWGFARHQPVRSAPSG